MNCLKQYSYIVYLFGIEQWHFILFSIFPPKGYKLPNLTNLIAFHRILILSR